MPALEQYTTSGGTHRERRDGKALTDPLQDGTSMERNTRRISLEYYASVGEPTEHHTPSNSRVMGYSTDARLADYSIPLASTIHNTSICISSVQ